ncbi:MAG: hypothetical protein KJO24_00850, partial [Gammaproteobacteria bacterium]|nr:hypothetical protein [Gammaproteobacteria bacterium]
LSLVLPHALQQELYVKKWYHYQLRLCGMRITFYLLLATSQDLLATRQGAPPFAYLQAACE